MQLALDGYQNLHVNYSFLMKHLPLFFPTSRVISTLFFELKIDIKASSVFIYLSKIHPIHEN